MAFLDGMDSGAVLGYSPYPGRVAATTQLDRLGSIATKTVAQSLSAALGAVRIWIVIRHLLNLG